MNPNEFDSDEEQDEPQQTEEASPALAYKPAPQSALPNPVLRNFDTPAAAATNTTPAATAQPAAPQPASADRIQASASLQPAEKIQASSVLHPVAQPPASQPANPAPAAPSQPYAAYEAATASAGSPPVTAATARQNQQDFDDMEADRQEKLRAHKAAGGATQVLPNGYEIIHQDADGNPW